MLKRAGACVAFLLLAALAASPLTLLLLTEAEIVAQSERIVLGTVTETQTRWLDPDGDGRENIYTVATFEVEQSVKGADQVGSVLSIQIYGGTIGNRTQGIGGVTPLRKGSRLILCLEKNAERCHMTPIVGVTQGIWGVRTDENGRMLAGRTSGEANFVARAANGSLVETRQPAFEEEELAVVLARLAQEVKK